MARKLVDLLQGLNYKTTSPVEELEQTEILQITEDSRRVELGTLFVALRGVHADGHLFIPSAIEAGAVAVLVEELPIDPQPHILYIEVESTAEALGIMSSHWYGDPSEELTVIGVTGTNGKTTSVRQVTAVGSLVRYATTWRTRRSPRPTLPPPPPSYRSSSGE